MRFLSPIPLLLFGVLLLYSCHKEPIGFLTTEYATYAPDSLVLKTKLDTTKIEAPNMMYELLISLGYTPDQVKLMGINPTEIVYSNLEEYRRYQNGTPWVSPSIQGLKGTAPITVEVTDIKPAGPAADLLRSLIQIRGSSGSIIIPTDHTIPLGSYTLSLRFSNEGWVKERADIFRIIVQ